MMIMAQDFGSVADIAVYYEITVFLIFNYILYLQYKYKKIKPTPLKNISFRIFIGYSVAIFFSAISKFLNARYGGVPETLYDSPYLGLVGRLHGARFSFIGVVIGTIYSYELYLRIFKKEIPKNKRNIVILIGLGICIFLGTVYSFNLEEERANQVFEIISFSLLLGFAMVVYIPFTVQAFKLAKRLKDVEGEENYRKGILSLGGASLSFICIFICLVLDRFMLIVFNIAYSAFYFMAWIFAIIAIWLVYAGFIKPAKLSQPKYKTKEKEERQK